MFFIKTKLDDDGKFREFVEYMEPNFHHSRIKFNLFLKYLIVYENMYNLDLFQDISVNKKQLVIKLYLLCRIFLSVFYNYTTYILKNYAKVII